MAQGPPPAYAVPPPPLYATTPPPPGAYQSAPYETEHGAYNSLPAPDRPPPPFGAARAASTRLVQSDGYSPIGGGEGLQPASHSPGSRPLPLASPSGAPMALLARTPSGRFLPLSIASGRQNPIVGAPSVALADEHTPFLDSRRGLGTAAVTVPAGAAGSAKSGPGQQPGGQGQQPAPKEPRPWVGYIILLGCLAGFATELAVEKGIAPLNVNPMIGPSSVTLIKCGAKSTPLILNGEWWRLVSPMWLHAGVVHIATNMNLLIRMGWPLERGIGHTRFAVLYVLSGIFSMAYSAIFSSAVVTVGASGALFGVIGALLGELLSNCHLLDPRDRCCNFIGIMLTIIINLAVGILPFVDNFAHIGGCVSGFLLGLGIIWHRDYKGGYKFRQVCVGFFSLAVWGCAVLLAVVLLMYNIDANTFCPFCKYISCVPLPWWTCSYQLPSPAANTTARLLQYSEQMSWLPPQATTDGSTWAA